MYHKAQSILNSCFSDIESRLGIPLPIQIKELVTGIISESSPCFSDSHDVTELFERMSAAGQKTSPERRIEEWVRHLDNFSDEDHPLCRYLIRQIERKLGLLFRLHLVTTDSYELQTALLRPLQPSDEYIVWSLPEFLMNLLGGLEIIVSVTYETRKVARSLAKKKGMKRQARGGTHG